MFNLTSSDRTNRRSYQRLQFDDASIDRSLVKDLLDDEGSLAIIRAITGLGVSLRITTTAEGVETEEQMRRLNREVSFSDVLHKVFDSLCLHCKPRPTSHPRFDR